MRTKKSPQLHKKTLANLNHFRKGLSVADNLPPPPPRTCGLEQFAQEESYHAALK